VFDTVTSVPNATRPANSNCSPDNPLKIRDSVGFLSNLYTEQHSGYGSSSCPWRISVEPGQRINITLLDFATPTATDALILAAPPSQDPAAGSIQGLGSTRVCYQYASVIERLSSTRTFHVCGGDRRERHVHTSLTNVIDVNVVARKNAETEKEYYFLLQFKGLFTDVFMY